MFRDKTIQLTAPLYIVLFDDLGTMEFPVARNLRDALTTIYEGLGTFEPNVCLCLEPEGSWRDVSAELAELWAGQIAADAMDIGYEADHLPKFVQRFMSAELFFDTYASNTEKRNQAEEYAAEMRLDTQRENL